MESVESSRRKNWRNQWNRQGERTRMAAPTDKVFLSHGREIMGNAKKDHLSQQTVVAPFNSLFGTSPIVCKHLWGRLDPDVEMSRAAWAKHLLWALA